MADPVNPLSTLIYARTCVGGRPHYLHGATGESATIDFLSWMDGPKTLVLHVNRRSSSGVDRGGQVGQVPPGARDWGRQNEY